MGIINVSELRGNLIAAAADYTVVAKDNFIDVDCTAGAVAITLEDLADARALREIKIRKNDVVANSITIAGDVNINGAANLVLTTQYDSVTLIAGATEWMISV